MDFEELASRAGDRAADIGRRADRPPFADIQRERLRQAWFAAPAAAAAVVLIVMATIWLWPAAEPSAPVAATVTTTTSAETTSPAVGGDRDSCPVTVPGESPFTPASEAPDGPPDMYDAVWYGTPELWTMLGREGQVWRGLPVGPDGSLTQKTFWFAEGYVFDEEPAPDITVTAENIDGSAPTVQAGGPGTNGTHVDLGSFMLVGLEIPTRGCWRITAEYRDATLSYVAWVDDSSPGSRTDLSSTNVVLLDGSDLELVIPVELGLAGFSFTLESPLGLSNVSLLPNADPASGRLVDQAAVLESEPGDGVRLWRADREGQPFFMTLDLGGWVALLHVGNQSAPASEVLLNVADQLSATTGQRGVILTNYAPDVFTSYLEDPQNDNQIHLVANQCVREKVPGADVLDDPRRGQLIRAPEYASWCEQDASVEVIAYGDRQFIEKVLADMTLRRRPVQQP